MPKRSSKIPASTHHVKAPALLSLVRRIIGTRIDVGIDWKNYRQNFSLQIYTIAV